MADDRNKHGRQDRERINVNQAYELRDWAVKFGVSEEKLRETVERVGPMARDVQKALGK